MDIKPEFNKKSIRSFVIRSGRLTEGQRLAFDQWWPIYGLSLADGLIDPTAIFGNEQPLVVEVGFGMGDSLLEMAKREPHINFIGIEVHPPGVGRIISCAGQEHITNLRVYMADATDVLRECFADQSLARFQLYFPDPWHKKKHHKRRIVQAPFVQLIAQKLQTHGILHMATDWQNYAEQMLQVLSAEPSLKNTVCEYAERPEYRPKTKFEERGERLGHGVWDLVFNKLA